MHKPTFPKEMAQLPNWVGFRLEPDKKTGRVMKVPYNPKTGYRASTANKNTWGTLEEALAAKEKFGFTGIGFVFDDESGIIGIDLDKCFIDEQLNDVAKDILAKTPPTYIELSPSGTGFHVFIKGKMPRGGNRNSGNGVEMYGTKRFFTMTGNLWNDCSDEIAVDNGYLQWVFDTYIKPKNGNKSSKKAETRDIQV